MHDLGRLGLYFYRDHEGIEAATQRGDGGAEPEACVGEIRDDRYGEGVVGEGAGGAVVVCAVCIGLGGELPDGVGGGVFGGLLVGGYFVGAGADPGLEHLDLVLSFLRARS